MYKKESHLKLADIAVRKRKFENSFLLEINRLISWQIINTTIESGYTKGKRPDGRPAFSGLLLYKIYLIKKWYSFTPKQMYHFINDSISASYFLGLSLEDELPSATTIRRFILELKQKGILSPLDQIIENQLIENKRSIIKGKYRDPYLKKLSTGLKNELNNLN